jgi:uncharacterized protein (DUF362 family)
MSSGSDSRPPIKDPRAVLSRRDFLSATAFAGAGLCATTAGARWYYRHKQPPAHVGIYRAASYREPLARIIREGLLNYPDVIRRARAGTVVLKPNLVEYHNDRSVNTHPAVVAGAIAAFRSVGAKRVVVAEGPGHCRDTELLLEQSDLEHAIESERSEFVDLNLDTIRSVALAANRTKLGEISFPATVLGASLVVSMPKLKTHHWAGVTLSLKNMFGTVPGARYGWPKNVLHWHGIENSIVDINLALKPGFAIIDGIEGMEGDGPLKGDTVPAGVLIMGNNPTAVDATATRVMGLHPERVKHLAMMLSHGGTLTEALIEQRGERIATVRQSFRVLDAFKSLQTPPVLPELLLRA